ncbi:hypothetical protein [Cellulomonas soli]
MTSIGTLGRTAVVPSRSTTVADGWPTCATWAYSTATRTQPAGATSAILEPMVW